MEIQVDRFVTLMINKVNALVAANDRRDTPWKRRDFITYIKGACDWFFFENNITKDVADVESVLATIYCDSNIIAEIEYNGG